MMKFSVVCVFLLSCAFLSTTLAHERTMTVTTLLNEGAKICMNDLDNEKHRLLELNNYEEISEADAHKCYHACIWKHTGLFVDNKFDIEKMSPKKSEYRNPLVRRMLRVTMYKCAAYSYEIEDECRKATVFHTCYRSMGRRLL